MGTRNKLRTLAHIEHIEVEDEGNLLTRLLDAFHLTPQANPETPNMAANPLEELQALQNLVNQLQGQIQNQDQLLQQHQAQIQAPPAPPRIKPDRPPPFSGRKTESLEAWIFQMQ